MLFSSLLSAGCLSRQLPQYSAHLSGVEGVHEFADIHCDIGFGIYEKGVKSAPVFLEIAFITPDSDYIKPLYVVNNTDEEECGWYYTGGCTQKINYEKNVPLCLSKDLFTAEKGTFKIGVLLYGLDQPDEERQSLSKSFCCTYNSYAYTIDGEALTIKGR